LMHLATPGQSRVNSRAGRGATTSRRITAIDAGVRSSQRHWVDGLTVMFGEDSKWEYKRRHPN